MVTIYCFRVMCGESLVEYVAADTEENATRVTRHYEGDVAELRAERSDRPLQVHMRACAKCDGVIGIGAVADHVQSTGHWSLVLHDLGSDRRLPAVQWREAGVRDLLGRLTPW